VHWGALGRISKFSPNIWREKPRQTEVQKQRTPEGLRFTSEQEVRLEYPDAHRQAQPDRISARARYRIPDAGLRTPPIRNDTTRQRLRRVDLPATMGCICARQQPDTDAQMRGHTLIKRFQGQAGKRLLVQSLMGQCLIGHDSKVATAIAQVCELRELRAGDVLIRQGDTDNTLYLILDGSLTVLVNGREVAVRSRGHHVGEMALIDPSLRRTATNVAREPTLVARVPERFFAPLADVHPRLWRALGAELARRLDQRARFHRPSNTVPRLFVGSSSEALPIAKALVSAVPANVAIVSLWSQGVFGASRFPIEDLETQVEEADFAALVLASDDRVHSRGADFEAPRDNVIFELGLFMGALTRHRTFILAPQFTKLKIPTDLLGLTQLRYLRNARSPRRAVGTVASDLVARIRKLGSR